MAKVVLTITVSEGNLFFVRKFSISEYITSSRLDDLICSY